jgi:hypothetical protein
MIQGNLVLTLGLPKSVGITLVKIMSFWDTFVKVWQVRKSIEIQEGIEDWFVNRRQQKQQQNNIEEIANEVGVKNRKWVEELKKQRKKY